VLGIKTQADFLLGVLVYKTYVVAHTSAEVKLFALMTDF
jgi:hypothetical protein